MDSIFQIGIASLLGLATTSSSLLGAAIGLYLPFSKRPLACRLAFAAGSLISALAIELAFESAQSLHQQGYNARAAWAFVSAGFAVGAILYYWAWLFLEKKGAAVRYVTQFRASWALCKLLRTARLKASPNASGRWRWTGIWPGRTRTSGLRSFFSVGAGKPKPISSRRSASLPVIPPSMAGLCLSVSPNFGRAPTRSDGLAAPES